MTYHLACLCVRLPRCDNSVIERLCAGCHALKTNEQDAIWHATTVDRLNEGLPGLGVRGKTAWNWFGPYSVGLALTA